MTEHCSMPGSWGLPWASKLRPGASSPTISLGGGPQSCIYNTVLVGSVICKRALKMIMITLFCPRDSLEMMFRFNTHYKNILSAVCFGHLECQVTPMSCLIILRQRLSLHTLHVLTIWKLIISVCWLIWNIVNANIWALPKPIRNKQLICHLFSQLKDCPLFAHVQTTLDCSYKVYFDAWCSIWATKVLHYLIIGWSIIGVLEHGESFL